MYHPQKAKTLFQLNPTIPDVFRCGGCGAVWLLKESKVLDDRTAVITCLGCGESTDLLYLLARDKLKTRFVFDHDLDFEKQ